MQWSRSFEQDSPKRIPSPWGLHCPLRFKCQTDFSTSWQAKRRLALNEPICSGLLLKLNLHTDSNYAPKKLPHIESVLCKTTNSPPRGLLNTQITSMLVLSHHFPTSFLELAARMEEKIGPTAPTREGTKGPYNSQCNSHDQKKFDPQWCYEPTWKFLHSNLHTGSKHVPKNLPNMKSILCKNNQLRIKWPIELKDTRFFNVGLKLYSFHQLPGTS